MRHVLMFAFRLSQASDWDFPAIDKSEDTVFGSLVTGLFGWLNDDVPLAKRALFVGVREAASGIKRDRKFTGEISRKLVFITAEIRAKFAEVNLCVAWKNCFHRSVSFVSH